MDEGAHFESEYFLTLTYLPPPEIEERAKGWLFEGEQQALGGKRHRFRFKNKLLSLDSTTISLCLTMFPWA